MGVKISELPTVGGQMLENAYMIVNVDVNRTEEAVGAGQSPEYQTQKVDFLGLRHRAMLGFQHGLVTPSNITDLGSGDYIALAEASDGFADAKKLTLAMLTSYLTSAMDISSGGGGLSIGDLANNSYLPVSYANGAANIDSWLMSQQYLSCSNAQGESTLEGWLSACGYLFASSSFGAYNLEDYLSAYLSYNGYESNYGGGGGGSSFDMASYLSSETGASDFYGAWCNMMGSYLSSYTGASDFSSAVCSVVNNNYTGVSEIYNFTSMADLYELEASLLSEINDTAAALLPRASLTAEIAAYIATHPSYIASTIKPYLDGTEHGDSEESITNETGQGG